MPADQLPEDPKLDERPQRRREWSGPLRSVGLPLLAVALIVGAVWHFENGRGSGTSNLVAGTGIVALDTSRNHTGKPPSPELVRAYSQYHGKGFEVVSVDEQKDPTTVKKWVDAFGMQFPVAMDVSGQVGQTFRAGNTFPTSMFVDASGVVTDIRYGPMSRDFLDQQLSALP